MTLGRRLDEGMLAEADLSGAPLETNPEAFLKASYDVPHVGPVWVGHQGCLPRLSSQAGSHACHLFDSMRDNRTMKIQSHEVSCIWV